MRRALALLLAAAVAVTGTVALDAGASASGVAHDSASKRKCAKKKTRKARRKCRRRSRPVATPTPTPTVNPSARPLVGTFKLDPGGYARADGPSGTYFRMIIPGGTVAKGPYFANGSSRASDQSYTLLRPGTDGGLITGAFQEPPAPAFSPGGNALARRITLPEPFVGVSFSLSTAARDAQTGLDVPAPSVVDDGGRLSGDLRAFSASWNKEHFNQGAPKPNGSTPGLTKAVSGTYDAGTGAFVLEWSSSIVGGPFASFTGYWHLAGTFQPSG